MGRRRSFSFWSQRTTAGTYSCQHGRVRDQALANLRLGMIPRLSIRVRFGPIRRLAALPDLDRRLALEKRLSARFRRGGAHCLGKTSRQVSEICLLR